MDYFPSEKGDNLEEITLNPVEWRLNTLSEFASVNSLHIKANISHESSSYIANQTRGLNEIGRGCCFPVGKNVNYLINPNSISRYLLEPYVATVEYRHTMNEEDIFERGFFAFPNFRFEKGRCIQNTNGFLILDPDSPFLIFSTSNLIIGKSRLIDDTLLTPEIVKLINNFHNLNLIADYSTQHRQNNSQQFLRILLSENGYELPNILFQKVSQIINNVDK